MTRGAKIARSSLSCQSNQSVYVCVWGVACMSIKGEGGSLSVDRYISHLLWSIFTEGDFSSSLNVIRLPRYKGLSVYTLMCFCCCSSNDKYKLLFIKMTLQNSEHLLPHSSTTFRPSLKTPTVLAYFLFVFKDPLTCVSMCVFVLLLWTEMPTFDWYVVVFLWSARIVPNLDVSVIHGGAELGYVFL